jgi:hypothetical protein
MADFLFWVGMIAGTCLGRVLAGVLSEGRYWVFGTWLGGTIGATVLAFGVFCSAPGSLFVYVLDPLAFIVTIPLVGAICGAVVESVVLIARLIGRRGSIKSSLMGLATMMLVGGLCLSLLLVFRAVHKSQELPV